MVRRSVHDREIRRLAVPALGALAAALYVPVVLLALTGGWGIVGVWWGLAGLIAVRLGTCGARFAGSRWARLGHA